MSIQAIFNENAIKAFPKLDRLISKAEVFEANQMKSYALREMINSKKRVSDMSEVELNVFQTDLIEVFSYKGWCNANTEH